MGNREERLLQQIAELQKCVEVADRLRGRRQLSYSSMEDDESVSGGDAGDARLGVTSSGAILGVTSSAILRVTPSGPPVVSDYVQLVSTSIPNYLSPPTSGRHREPTPMHGVTSAGEKGNLFGSGSAWRVLGDSGCSCTVSAGGSTGGIGVHYIGTSRLSTSLGNSGVFSTGVGGTGVVSGSGVVSSTGVGS